MPYVRVHSFYCRTWYQYLILKYIFCCLFLVRRHMFMLLTWYTAESDFMCMVLISVSCTWSRNRTDEARSPCQLDQRVVAKLLLYILQLYTLNGGTRMGWFVRWCKGQVYFYSIYSYPYPISTTLRKSKNDVGNSSSCVRTVRVPQTVLNFSDRIVEWDATPRAILALNIFFSSSVLSPVESCCHCT